MTTQLSPPSLPALDAPRISARPSTGIVLGAGGPFGWPYHLGVAEGLRAALDWRPSTSTRIIGTSAGGAIAASLLAGASSEEILAAITQPMSIDEQAQMRAARDGLTHKPWRRLRPQAPSMVRAGGLVGLSGLAPAGVFPTLAMRRFPVHSLDEWPEQLWLPAVELDTGRTVVFGRDRTDVAVVDALEATAAVPLLFQPKTIGDARYIDGATSSATHANLLAPADFDLVVVSSPATRPGSGLLKRRARRQLQREVADLETAGSQVVVITPTERTMQIADGFPRSNPDAGPAIVDAAREQTIEAVAKANLCGVQLQH